MSGTPVLAMWEPTNTVMQFYEYTQRYGNVYFMWIKFIVYELYLNKKNFKSH